MDPRAAKGIAANIRVIAEATTRIVLIDAKVGISGDAFVSASARVDCLNEIEKAQSRIATWLMQPMTHR